MKNFLKEIQYCFNNYFLLRIPFWPIRKLFYVLQGMRIGKGARILMDTKIVSPKNIIIGKNSFINEGCYLDGRGGIKIGDNVTIAVFSKIITGSHNIDDEDFSFKSEKVVIGDNSAIFSNSVVLGGVNIGNGCVFSASSLIRRGDYESKGIYGGNPAIFIRDRKSACQYSQESWHPIFR